MFQLHFFRNTMKMKPKGERNDDENTIIDFALIYHDNIVPKIKFYKIENLYWNQGFDLVSYNSQLIWNYNNYKNKINYIKNITPFGMDLAGHVVLSLLLLLLKHTTKNSKLRLLKSHSKRTNSLKHFRICQIRNCKKLLLNWLINLYWCYEFQDLLNSLPEHMRLYYI